MRAVRLQADRWIRAGWVALRALVGGLAVIVAPAVLAQGARASADTLPVEVFFQRPQVLQAVLSPSGRRLAMTMTAANRRVGLFVLDLQSPDLAPSRAALFGDADVTRPVWLDDERLVFSADDRQVGSAEAARSGLGLYAARFDGTEFLQLVERKDRPFIGSIERATTLHWNHALLHVPLPGEQVQGARADEVIVGELSLGSQDVVRVHPLWLNTRSGRTRRVVMEDPPPHAAEWWFSPQGLPRLVRTRQAGREALHWYTPANAGQPARWRLLTEGRALDMPFEPLWVGEGDRLYVMLPEGPAREMVVAPFDFATNRPGDVLVRTPGFDFNGRLIGDREGRELLGVEVHTDAEQTVWFHPAYQAAQQLADAQWPGRVNDISCRRCGSADAVMLVRSYSDRHPGELLLWRQADNGGQGQWRRVGLVRPGIDPDRMARMDLHRIQARDGRDLPVWITRPAGMQDKGDARPAVVLLHGGPWSRGGFWGWQPLPQFLASRGWVVIEPEFRGSDGYGRVHLEAGFRQWGRAMQDDVADALLWARAAGLANDRACLVGASYGGYSALMGLVRHPELYRCASASVAVTDPLLYVGGAWWLEDNVSAYGRRHDLPTMVGHAEKDREMLLANSPLAQAARIQAPVQLIWGREDRRVPLVHGERMRDALRAAGRPPEWIVYDGEGHGLGRGDNQVDMARKMADFLTRHLQVPPASR